MPVRAEHRLMLAPSPSPFNLFLPTCFLTFEMSLQVETQDGVAERWAVAGFSACS
jgi:hypothetical protein